MLPIRLRAGRAALEHLRRFGLRGQIRAFVLPATGPKWLVAYGFDQALIEAGLLGDSEPTLLAGASAGAWRALSLASPDPAETHRRLMRAYCEAEFSRTDTPHDVLRVFREMLLELFAGRERSILTNRSLELAIHTARARGATRWPGARGHLLSLAAAALANPFGTRAQRCALERVTFYSEGARESLYSLSGSRVPLSEHNLLEAALASACVPLAMEPIRGITGAPRGVYLDGGMTDYHLADPYLHPKPGVTLLFTHQRRILARWLDQFLAWRELGPDALEHTLHVYPSEEFVSGLPGGQVPTRQDYTRMLNDSAERIRRWKQVVDRSSELGSAFLETIESSGWLDRVECFER